MKILLAASETALKGVIIRVLSLSHSRTQILLKVGLTSLQFETANERCRHLSPGMSIYLVVDGVFFPK